jgi:RNA polymerase sigma factor (sigma-70 family)
MLGTTHDNLLSDEQLAETIARRQRSDSRAWQEARHACGQLYLRHAPKLLAFLAARASRSDLEDIHQAIWERVWQHLPDGFHGGNFRAWLYQIARNYLIDQGRKKRIDPLGEDQPLPDPRAPQPDEPLLEQERMLILRRCLERLTAEAAQLVQARLAGESYVEVCQRLGMKPERAHKVFHQAKEQLQSCVERAMP